MRSIALLTVIANVTILAPSFHMLQVYDRVLNSRSVPTLVAITAIALFALVVYGTADAVRMRVARRLANAYGVSVSPKLFECLETVQTGADGGKLMRDFTAAGNFLASKLFVNLFDLPFLPLFGVVLYLVHPLVCLISFIGLAAMIGIGWLNLALTRRAAQASRAAEAEASAFGMSAIARHGEIRAHGMLSDLSRLWAARSARAILAAEAAGNLSGDLSAISRTLRQMIQIVNLAWGAWLVLHGDMSGGMIFMASMVSGKLLQPVEQAIAGWDGTVKSLEAFETVDRVTRHHTRLVERPSLPEPQGLMELRDVAVTLESERTVLTDVNFWVMPGECVMVDGPIASGKSLLLETMAGGREPSRGVLLLDSAPRARWPMRQWGRAVGYYSDGAGLIQGTVAANIARFSPQADQEEIYRVASGLGLHEAIAALPQGYQTPIAEGTRLLSSGQRRLLLLARAFYGSPKVLILDQPTLGLDQETEGAVTNLLSDAKRARAAIVLVSRSVLLWRLADRAMRIDGRRLTESPIERPRRPAPSGLTVAPPAAMREVVS